MYKLCMGQSMCGKLINFVLVSVHAWLYAPCILVGVCVAPLKVAPPFHFLKMAIQLSERSYTLSRLKLISSRCSQHDEGLIHSIILFPLL